MNKLKDPIVIFVIVSSIAALLALIFSTQTAGYDAMDLLANITVFLASALLSYLITNYSTTETYKKEIQNLVKFVSRRISLSVENTVKLTSTVEDSDDTMDVKDFKRLTVYALTNLSDDMNASLVDIVEIGDLQLDESEAESVNVNYNCMNRPGFAGDS